MNADQISEFCARHKIKQLSVFGSTLTGPAEAARDLDLLIEFEAGHEVGLFKLAEMELELTRLVGKPVDLRTPAELSRYFRDDVLKTAVVLYAA